MGKKLGSFIKQQREELGVSQESLSAVLGAKSRQTMSNIERGTKPLPMKFIVPLSKALNISHEDLIQVMTEEFQMNCFEAAQLAETDSASADESSLSLGVLKPS